MVAFAVLLTIFYISTLFLTTKAKKIIGKAFSIVFYALFTVFYFGMMYFSIFNHP